MRHRTFTAEEQQARDRFSREHTENDCAGCIEDLSEYGAGWTPAQDCPVHGEGSRGYFEELNELLDERWPGRWVGAAA